MYIHEITQQLTRVIHRNPHSKSPKSTTCPMLNRREKRRLPPSSIKCDFPTT